MEVGASHTGPRVHMENFQSTSDIRLIERAIRNKWNIPDIVMELVPKMMLKIVAEGKDREKIGAAKVLAEMVKHNAEADRPTPEPQSPIVNVGVNIESNPDTGRSRIAVIGERVRARRISQSDT